MGANENSFGMSLSDAELVSRCNAGISDAFGILMSRHETALRRRIRGFGVSQPLADDLEQETWVRAYQKLHGLREGDRFGAWLMQVADTVCLAALRKDQRRDEIARFVDTDIETLAAAGDPAEDLSTVTGLLVHLPPQYSEVLMLRYLEQLSLEEISAETGLTVSGVKWRLNRAKQEFKEALEEMTGQETDKVELESILHRANVATQASRWDEAIEAYEAAARKADLDWHSLQELGRMYERRGDFARAIKLLEQALRLNDWPWLRIIIGWCYDGLGEREKAIETYESVLLSGSCGPWAAHTALAGVKAPHQRRKSEPEPAGKERAVPQRGWSAKTNHNQDQAHLAFDGDLSTAWTSMAAQEPNHCFELDLGRTWEVTRVVLDDDGGGQCIWLANCPHGHAIETSADGVTWQKVAEGYADADRYAGASLDGSPVRYIRTRLTQYFQPNWWSIYEIRVYAK